MRARLILTTIAVILYVGLFNIYILELTRCDIKTEKLFYNYLTSGALIFALADLKAGFVNTFHSQFNLLLFLCIIFNYGLIILTHMQVLCQPLPMFYTFNGGVFFITVTIFFNEIRYKIFTDD